MLMGSCHRWKTIITDKLENLHHTDYISNVRNFENNYTQII